MTISAKIIADSISEVGKRLTTLQLRYPKFIHGEVMTHRVFSRNASSSRAIPVERLIKDVIDDPVFPSFWGKNQPGMQAAEECSTFVDWLDWPADTGNGKLCRGSREAAWDYARKEAIKMARAFHEAGYHKQIVNRLIEPFCHINVVVTATEFSNFFALRCHKDAQPEMRMLAEAMANAMRVSEPKLLRVGTGDEWADEWHLPYVTDEDHKPKLDMRSEGDVGYDKRLSNAGLIKLSVARCARVSYLTQEGKPPNIEEDLKLYDRLVGGVPLHASPTEHQATPDQKEFSDFIFTDVWKHPHLHGNLVGWIQYRKMLPGECQ